MSSDPNDPIRLIHDERNPIADVPCNFPIHEEVLQFLLSVEAERPKSVARTPVTN